MWPADFLHDRQQLAIAVASSIFAYISYKALYVVFIRSYSSPFKELPGPDKIDSYLWGHFPRIFKAPSPVVHEEWAALYGPTFQYRAFFLARLCFTMDPRAVSHMINHAYDYPKPPAIQELLTALLGKGVLTAEGDVHRRQRKIMNPCFGNAQIRELVPIFNTKAFQLRDIWLHEISEHSEEPGYEVDVLEGLSRATLDIIGFAGFSYNFNALVEGETNELARAFHDLLTPTNNFQIFPFLQSRFPILKLIPTERGRIEKKSREVLARVGHQLIQEKKAALLVEKDDGGALHSKNVAGRDLLSVLAKANMASDIKDSEKMTDEEMMGQISTMLAAGHETTSSTTMWLLHELSKPPQKPIQDRLRAELLTLPEDASMEELNALPYLDAVIRENLRLNAVVTELIRDAAHDDVIPLSVPFVDRKGVERRELRIRKGDAVFMSPLAMNRDKTIWGEDALEFNPERWFKPESHSHSSDIPSVYSGIMTFIGGPRHCIGYRFALAEMKVLANALIRNISYSLSEPVYEIEKKTGIVTRPLVTLRDGTKKSCMPLILKAVGGDD
ncbi:hypothetical protein FRB93_010841 [Tulasnella sp. JGI-2019a]|nr:hypothetical protein FRB93_010841 [Tulasnella sp. JGI-2019a]